MTHNFLTIHSLTVLPHHNRNRDDRGQPKQLREGGAVRAYLSSQSRKRAMRVGYEAAAQTIGENTGSVRSRTVDEAAVERAIELAAERGTELSKDDLKNIRARATRTVKSLTVNLTKAEAAGADAAARKRLAHASKAPAGANVDERMAAYDAQAAEPVDEQMKDAAVWASDQEIENLAAALLASTEDIPAADVFTSTTASLANASFGRMLAAEPGARIEAAIAVTAAATTHAVVINRDYFIAQDDRTFSGAHLDQAFYTNGVYYGSATIDRRQLRKNWEGLDGRAADALLRELAEQIALALPQGRKNVASADTLPSVLIAEQQRARTGYQFQTPVTQDASGGFLNPSIDELYRQANAARAFAPRQFGPTVVSGLVAFGERPGIDRASVANLDGLIDFIVDWIRA